MRINRLTELERDHVAAGRGLSCPLNDSPAAALKVRLEPATHETSSASDRASLKLAPVILHRSSPGGFPAYSVSVGHDREGDGCGRYARQHRGINGVNSLPARH